MRVVQLSDSHLSAASGIPKSVQSLLDWINVDPPDLVVHTGDIVWFDPDDTLDRAFARLVLSKLPCPMLSIPGNHDVGFFETERLPARLATFRATWGDDRFVHEADGWRLVGFDIYTVGDADADAWLANALDTERPIAVFVHQPLSGEPDDGWQAPDRLLARCDELIAGHDVRVEGGEATAGRRRHGHAHRPDIADLAEQQGGRAAGVEALARRGDAADRHQ